jgi:SH3-like domain-containing protein
MRIRFLASLAIAATLAGVCAASDMRQITENGTILFDGPSNKSNKQFILGVGTPVEVIVTVAGWVKVRDAGGSLGWVEPRQVGPRTNVQVRVPFATVRAQASETAPVVFSAERDVLLRLAEPAPTSGWVRVAHRDGASGFARIESLFGL